MVKTYIAFALFCATVLAQTDPTALWPTATAGPWHIPLAVDSSASPLVTDINGVTQSVQVLDGSRFKIYQLVRLNSEKMLITNIVGNTLTVTRGYAGT